MGHRRKTNPYMLTEFSIAEVKIPPPQTGAIYSLLPWKTILNLGSAFTEVGQGGGVKAGFLSQLIRQPGSNTNLLKV